MRHCPHMYIRATLITATTTMTPNPSARVRWPVATRAAAADAKTSA